MTSGKDKSNTYKSDGWVARTREQQRRRVGKIEERHLSLSISLSIYVGGVWVGKKKKKIQRKIIKNNLFF